MAEEILWQVNIDAEKAAKTLDAIAAHTKEAGKATGDIKVDPKLAEDLAAVADVMEKTEKAAHDVSDAIKIEIETAAKALGLQKNLDAARQRTAQSQSALPPQTLGSLAVSTGVAAAAMPEAPNVTCGIAGGGLSPMNDAARRLKEAAHALSTAAARIGEAKADQKRITEGTNQDAQQLQLGDANDRRKKAEAERTAAIATLRHIAVGTGLGAAAVIGSHAKAGFQDTLQGQQADVYGQLLNRQVASIFAPLLEEKTKYVSQMTSWLSDLREPQRESVRQMTVFATSMGSLGFLLPKVTKGVAAALSMGQTASGAAGGIGGTASAAGMAGPVGIALAGMFSILASSERGRASLVGLAKAFEPLIPPLSNMVESLTPTLTAVADSTAKLVTWLNNHVPNIAPSPATIDSFDTGWIPRKLREMGIISSFWLRNDPSQMDSQGRRVGGALSGAGGSSGLSPVPKGFEDIGRDYERIFAAATKIDLQQKVADNTAATAANTAILVQQITGQGKPPILQGVDNLLANVLGF